ncbi:MAG: hypothetical protein QXO33_04440 [Nitrososphaeria archaeon]
MSDAGIYTIGFMVSSLSVYPGNIKEISPFAFFLNAFIPIFDTPLAIWRRGRLNKDLFKMRQKAPSTYSFKGIQEQDKVSCCYPYYSIFPFLPCNTFS